MWSRRCLLASEQKACGAPAVDPVQFPGVIVEGMHQHGQRYQINGREVTRSEAFRSVATIPDDRKAMSLTFIGTPAENAAGVAEAKKAGLDKSCLVQCLPPDSPLLKNGFVTTGHPTVYLQSPDGQTLARRQDASPSSLDFVAYQAANYDPTKDPTGNGLTLADIEKKIAAVPAWLWFVIGAVAVYLWNRPKQPPVKPS
jgi:hypothetical protein